MAALGPDREIGLGRALSISLLLSPLIGALFVATSPSIRSEIPLPRGVPARVDLGGRKFSRETLDGALTDNEALLTLQCLEKGTFVDAKDFWGRIPVSEDTFVIRDLSYFRMRFEMDATRIPTRIIRMYEGGQTDESARE